MSNGASNDPRYPSVPVTRTLTTSGPQPDLALRRTVGEQVADGHDLQRARRHRVEHRVGEFDAIERRRRLLVGPHDARVGAAQPVVEQDDAAPVELLVRALDVLRDGARVT